MPRKNYKRRPTKTKSSKFPADRPIAKLNKARAVSNYAVKSEPFPRVMYTRVKYGTRINLAQTLTDVSVANSFRLNSIYDPDFTNGAGSQTAVGHAALASIYDQYWVMGAKVKVSFNDPLADGGTVGVKLRINGNNSANGRSVQQLSGQPLCYMAKLNDSGKQSKTFSFYVRPWSLVGCSKLEYMANSSTYSSDISNNPAAGGTCLMDVFMVNPRVASTNINCTVQIIYYVKMYSRKELSASTFA